MGGVGDHDLAPLLVLSAIREVGVHQHQACELALRAGRGLEGHRRKTGDFRQRLLELDAESERSLHVIFVLERVQVAEPW